jgi:hypothetical protein
MLPSLETSLGQYEKALRVEGLPFKSICLVDKSLYRFFNFLGQQPEQVAATDVLTFIKSQLACGYKPATVAVDLRHACRYFDWLQLAWPGRGLSPKQIALGVEPDGLPGKDERWDD